MDNHHDIVINGSDQDQQQVNIPLYIRGVISHLPSHKSTREEYEGSDPDVIIEMTVEEPEWDSRTTWFESQEESMTDSSGKLIDRPMKWGNRSIIAALQTLPQGEQPAIDFGLALARTVNTLTPRIASKGKKPDRVKVLNTSSRRNPLSPQILARRWGTHIETEKRTLDATTQRGVRSVLNLNMTRRYQTNDRQLRYRLLSHHIFTDTLEVSVRSWFHQNRYAQVFATAFGWCRIYPMRKKRDAHHGLSLMAAWYGVPPHLIMDG